MGRQARYVVRKADGVSGDPIPEDEPVLVIRAQDMLALDMIGDYLIMYKGLPGYSEQVVQELEEHRHAIAEWQETHPTKLADR